MKFRTVILIAFVALVTFSFTFVTVKKNVATSKVEQTSNADGNNAPVGGFALEKVNK